MAQGQPLSENIALLRRFGEYPVSPKTNEPPAVLLDTAAGNSWRSLTLEQERLTAEAFALLLTCTDDYRKVGAVCIEENPHTETIVVRTAVNTGGQFARLEVFSRLISAAKRPRSNDRPRNHVLEAVVDTSIRRLLIRLQSKHAPKSSSRGRPVVTQLQEILKALKESGPGLVELNRLRDAAGRLGDLSKSLETMSRDAALSTDGQSTVTEMLELIRDEIVHPYPPLLKDANVRACKQLLRRFRKLGQYVSASRQIARICKLPQNWQVQEANDRPYVESTAGYQPPGQSFLPNLLATGNDKQRKLSKAKLEAILDKNLPAITAAVNETMREERKVHAEIQIIYYYLQQPGTQNKPRVIASNKEACYLCDLFIASFGRMYTPKSHGKLYTMWRLPREDELQLSKKSRKVVQGVAENFNRAIEMQLGRFIDQRPRNKGCGSESSVFLSGAYTPSTASIASTAVNETRLATEPDLPTIDEHRELQRSDHVRDDLAASPRISPTAATDVPKEPKTEDSAVAISASAKDIGSVIHTSTIAEDVESSQLIEPCNSSLPESDPVKDDQEASITARVAQPAASLDIVDAKHDLHPGHSVTATVHLAQSVRITTTNLDLDFEFASEHALSVEPMPPFASITVTNHGHAVDSTPDGVDIIDVMSISTKSGDETKVCAAAMRTQGVILRFEGRLYSVKVQWDDSAT